MRLHRRVRGADSRSRQWLMAIRNTQVLRVERPPKLPRCRIDAQEHLLREVGGLLAVAREAQGEVVDHLAETVVDLVERLQIAAAMARDQLDVVGYVIA